MREIKFRAWDKEHNCFRGDEEDNTLDKYERLAILNSSDFEIMQFTGLKDKNGKEIYDGDIVERTYEYEGKKSTARARIDWDDNPAMYYFDVLTEEEWIDDWEMENCGYFEVIGNIYENPELAQSPEEAKE